MPEVNHEKLIAEYRESVRTRTRLRVSLAAVLLSAFFGFGMVLWKAGSEFSRSGLATVKQEIVDHVQSNGDRYTNTFSVAAGGIFSAYREAAAKQFERDLPKFEVAAQHELDELNKFTQARWKDFERDLVTMSQEHEQIIREELDKIVAPPRRDEIVKMYGKEIQIRVERALRTYFGDHLRVGEEIAANLDRISELEPDISHPIGVHHSVGLMLELAGLELQEIDN